MSVLSTGILIAFAVCVFVSFFVPFVRDGVARQLTWRLSLLDLRNFCVLLLPSVVLLGIGQFCQVVPGNGVFYFTLGITTPFLLRRLNFPPRLAGLLLLMLSVLMCTGLEPEAVLAPLEATLAGLVVWKFSENLYFQANSTLEDVLPAMAFLSGLGWIDSQGGGGQLVNYQGLVLATLGIACLLRIVQGPFLLDDRLYVKRLVLAASGGLFVLIFITKLLVAPDMSPLAALFGGGIFLHYLLEELEKEGEKGSRAAQTVKQLILIGIFTLAASRLYGTLGWLVLAYASLVATRSSIAVWAGLFWITRVMLQSFIFQFNPNVTGINITHAYAGAALYAGFFLVILMSILLRDVKDRRLSLSCVLAVTTLAPLATNYFLHAEPTASFLVSASVASILLVVLSPVIYQQDMPKQENLLLVPLQMILVALIAGKLIDIGNVASIHEKMTLICYFVAAVLIALIFTRWWTSRSRRQAVEISGN